jgi:FkbM family methyltransferase
MLTAAIILLAVVLAAVIIVMQERHQRHRRRLTRLERTTAEQLLMLKPLYSERAAARLRELGRTPRHPIEFRSQFGEDILLYNLFDGKTEGFFIEVGAYDGYTYAVTYAFECLGWTGLLVEPIPERFEACKARRPGSRVVHAALSKRGSSGTATFSHIVSAKKHYEASSFLPGSVSGKRYMRPPKTDTISLTVPLTTMNDLLNASPSPFPHGGVDFLVLDVEGGELNLLDGFDLDTYRPKAILIEDQAMGRDTTVLDYLTARGYEHVTWLSYNRLLVRKDEPELLARAKQLAQI